MEQSPSLETDSNCCSNDHEFMLLSFRRRFGRPLLVLLSPFSAATRSETRGTWPVVAAVVGKTFPPR